MTPLWGERPLLRHEWVGENCYLVGILHDFIPYVLKEEYYPGNQAGLMEYVSKMFNLHQYDYLFANSDYTKGDAHKLVKIKKERIKAIYCGEGNSNISAINFREIEKKYRIESKYFLYPTGDAPQKNVTKLLLAYISAKKMYKEIPKLIITGQFHETSRSRIRRILHYYQMEEFIVFTGYVPLPELNALYFNAFWVLYPSLYEGFGMPVIEAWNHNVPVLTSDAASLKEIAQDCAVLVNPYSMKSIANGLVKISKMDGKEREKYILAGIQRAKEYTWDRTTDLFNHYIGEFDYPPMKCIDSLKMSKYAKDLMNNEINESNLDIKRDNSKELVKLKNNFTGIEKWMLLRDYGLSIRWFFNENNYKKIAIYGMGIMANHLMMELMDDEIVIKYGIDRAGKHLEDIIPIFSLEEELPSIDAIIVTILYDFETIKGTLSNLINAPIISLQKVIDDTYIRYNL